MSGKPERARSASPGHFGLSGGSSGRHVNPNPVVGHNRLFRAVVALLERDETVALQFREVAVDRADVALKQQGKLADTLGLLALNRADERERGRVEHLLELLRGVKIQPAARAVGRLAAVRVGDVLALVAVGERVSSVLAGFPCRLVGSSTRTVLPIGRMSVAGYWPRCLSG
jgi:hypothetical protein